MNNLIVTVGKAELENYNRVYAIVHNGLEFRTGNNSYETD